jgi:ABC-type glutathione transport system ATPase component
VGSAASGSEARLIAAGVLQVEGLSKTYRSRTRGDVRAIYGVSFGVAPGEIVGLLGAH